MFHKVMFSRSDLGTTAGIVVDATKFDVRDVASISRLFPVAEAPKMRQYHVSPAYQTFEQAFEHVFDVDILGNTLARL